jgi:hypothetical protein
MHTQTDKGLERKAGHGRSAHVEAATLLKPQSAFSPAGASLPQPPTCAAIAGYHEGSDQDPSTQRRREDRELSTVA